jgi:hypothetical protein
LSDQLSADYAATWEHHRLRFALTTNDPQDQGAANGVADLANDALDYVSADADSDLEIRLIGHTEYAKGALADPALAGRWLLGPKSQTDARSTLAKVLPMPAALKKSLATSANSVRRVGEAAADHGVPVTAYEWTAAPAIAAAAHIPSGATLTIEMDVGADHLVRQLKLSVVSHSSPGPADASPHVPSGVATLRLSDFDAVPSITPPSDALTRAELGVQG